MAERDTPLLAVLIDADNTTPKAAKAIFDEIASLGEAAVRRLYGDFSSPRMKGWLDIIAGLAIIPHQQSANTTGKNASDIALVIDAMDLLHSDRFDGFVLVSSDSDFTRLASRIREQGYDVYGIGERKTPEAFRRACKRFLFIENIVEASSEEGSEKEPDPSANLSPPTAAIPKIRAALSALGEDPKKHNLSLLGKQLIASDPDFDPRNFGSPKLSHLIERTGYYIIDRDVSPWRILEKKGATTQRKRAPVKQ
ncbi:NYN domain-containing protein [Notoacmeibacter ruber]|uniref:NYN domain-containing protein n=1 Tax=Notoacmeibacter ruber TaxID=2670375 RepID=A0A3L7JA14_9HYPH|nr:NYN domain-containing protein [Notoacmeibacter ruber]RLQ87195.1 NYN domain-containing protein [Notoacmeibacter ruber]